MNVMIFKKKKKKMDPRHLKKIDNLEELYRNKVNLALSINTDC